MPTGIAPPDVTTPVGELRYLIGDYEYQPLDPPVEGMGEYAAFSDDELETLLILSGGSLPRTIGYAYLKLAGAAAGGAVSWASDDLRVSLEKTPAELRAIAEMWFDRAGQEDVTNGEGDYFDLVPFGKPKHRHELSEWPLW